MNESGVYIIVVSIVQIQEGRTREVPFLVIRGAFSVFS